MPSPHDSEVSNNDKLRIKELEDEIIIIENDCYKRITEFSSSLEILQNKYTESIQQNTLKVEELDNTTKKYSDLAHEKNEILTTLNPS